MKKKNTGVPLWVQNAIPFPTKPRKCNHWATWGFLDLGSKFNGAPHIKKMTDGASVKKFFKTPLKNLFQINKMTFKSLKSVLVKVFAFRTQAEKGLSK